MDITSPAFKESARQALHDAHLGALQLPVGHGHGQRCFQQFGIFHGRPRFVQDNLLAVGDRRALGPSVYPDEWLILPGAANTIPPRRL